VTETQSISWCCWVLTGTGTMDRRVWSLTLTLWVVGLSLFVNDVDAEATPRGFRELFIGRCIDYQQRDIYRWWTSKGYVIALVLGPWLMSLKRQLWSLVLALALKLKSLALRVKSLALRVKFLALRSSRWSSGSSPWPCRWTWP